MKVNGDVVNRLSCIVELFYEEIQLMALSDTGFTDQHAVAAARELPQGCTEFRPVDVHATSWIATA